MELLLTSIRFLFLFLLPGLLFSLVLFDGKKIDLLERIALSVGLSLAVIPMSVFYANLIGMPITILTVSILVLCLCGACLIILSIKLWRKHEKK